MPFSPRPALAERDARSLACELLAMPQSEFSAAFKGSPMKHATRRGLKHNATVVLGNVGTAEDEDVLAAALEDEETPAREHAGWALTRLSVRRRSRLPASPSRRSVASNGGA